MADSGYQYNPFGEPIYMNLGPYAWRFVAVVMYLAQTVFLSTSVISSNSDDYGNQCQHPYHSLVSVGGCVFSVWDLGGGFFFACSSDVGAFVVLSHTLLTPEIGPTIFAHFPHKHHEHPNATTPIRKCSLCSHVTQGAHSHFATC